MISVGQMLKDRRESKKLSFDDIHKFIKIHPRFLEALENGNYSVFSSKVHAKGFLKIYAEFLDLNVDQVLAFWRREYEIEFDKKVPKNVLLSDSKFKSNSFIITPGLIFSVFIGILIFGFFSYLYFQYRNFVRAPELEIYYPPNSIVVNDPLIDITGKTDLDSLIYINNQRIFSNSDGTFATSLKLSEGLNTININSISRLGKETAVVRTIIYRPLSNEVPSPLNAVEVSESTESVQE